MIYPQNFEQKIGFDQIRQLTKNKCLSPLGMEKTDDMDFSDSYDEINRRLDQVMEFMRIIQEEDDFPSQYFFDVRPSLKRIRIEGMYLNEQELLTCAVHWKRSVTLSASCNGPTMKRNRMKMIQIHPTPLCMNWQKTSWSFHS